MHSSRIKRLLVICLLWSTASASAQNLAEKELVPLIQKLVDAPLGIDGPCGPPMVSGLPRNFVKVEVLQISDAETADASPTNSMRGIPTGQKTWPVRAYVVVATATRRKGKQSKMAKPLATHVAAEMAVGQSARFGLLSRNRSLEA